MVGLVSFQRETMFFFNITNKICMETIRSYDLVYDFVNFLYSIFFLSITKYYKTF